MITIPLEAGDASLVLSDAVMEHFALHQQVRRDQSEAGGQLFARITRYEIFVEEATGPRPTDRRGRTHYTPDRQAERKEILERFALGLHYVGDWHTHPESMATPSPIDRFTISDCSRSSTHKLAGFVLMVIGNGSFPECMHISLHDRSSASGFVGSLRRWWTGNATGMVHLNIPRLERPASINTSHSKSGASRGKNRDK